MLHFERSYGTARAIFSNLEFVGWCLVGLGTIVALIGFSTGGIAGMGFGDPPFGLRLISMIPGIGLALAGLVSVAFTQSSRANVDSAEMSREMLTLMRQGNTVTVGNGQIAKAVSIGSRETDKQGLMQGQVKDASVESTEAYRGYRIRPHVEGVMVSGSIFSDIERAKQFIDKMEDK